MEFQEPYNFFLGTATLIKKTRQLLVAKLKVVAVRIEQVSKIITSWRVDKNSINVQSLAAYQAASPPVPLVMRRTQTRSPNRKRRYLGDGSFSKTYKLYSYLAYSVDIQYTYIKPMMQQRLQITNARFVYVPSKLILDPNDRSMQHIHQQEVEFGRDLITTSWRHLRRQTIVNGSSVVFGFLGVRVIIDALACRIYKSTIYRLVL